MKSLLQQQEAEGDDDNDDNDAIPEDMLEVLNGGALATRQLERLLKMYVASALQNSLPNQISSFFTGNFYASAPMSF